MYTVENINGYWYVCLDGKTVGTWIHGRMPRTQEECLDAAQRLNNGATIEELPKYGPQYNPNKVVAVASWGDDTYTAEDAENGCIPSDAIYLSYDEED